MSEMRARSNILLGFDGIAHSNSSSNTESVSNAMYKKPWFKSRLLSVLCVAWLILTLCLAIMMIVSLVQPQWIGRNLSGAKASFGLYRTCSWTRTGDCEGSMLEFNDIPSSAWRAASVLVLLAVIICFVAVLVWAAFWLCFMEHAYSGFRVCSLLLLVAGKKNFMPICTFLMTMQRVVYERMKVDMKWEQALVVDGFALVIVIFNFLICEVALNMDCQ